MRRGDGKSFGHITAAREARTRVDELQRELDAATVRAEKAEARHVQALNRNNRLWNALSTITGGLEAARKLGGEVTA
jgi:hypothetical protein